MVGNLSYFAKKIFVQFSFKLVKLVVSNFNAFWSSKSRKESDIDLLMVNSAINLVEAWKLPSGKKDKPKEKEKKFQQTAITSYFKKLITRKLEFRLSLSKNGREFGLFTVTPFLRKWSGI